MTQAQAADVGSIDRRTWMLCWVIVLGSFASGLDSSIINVGIETIGNDLDSALSLTQWTASGYLLALALSLPTAGWMARRFGSGRLWLCALGAFTIASAACAFAPTIEVLIAGRVVQGLAGGLLIPTGQTIFGQAVGPQRLGRVMGTLGIAVSAAPALGSLLSGAILHVARWPWLFLVNVPIGLVALAMGLRMVPRGPRTTAAPVHRTGLALITIGLPALVYSTSRWGDTGALTDDAAAAEVLAVIALALFVVVTRRARSPLLDLRLFSIAGFRAGAITAFASGALIFGSGVLFALYFLMGRGESPLQTGISVLGAALATALTAPLTGFWVDRRGPGPAALTGASLAVVSLTALTVLPTGASQWAIQPLLILFGAAVSLVAMPAGISAYRSVTAEQLPDAITQVNIVQRIGGSLGGAMCAVLVAGNMDTLDTGLRYGFHALTLAALGSLVGAILIVRAVPGRAAADNA